MPENSRQGRGPLCCSALRGSTASPLGDLGWLHRDVARDMGEEIDIPALINLYLHDSKKTMEILPESSHCPPEPSARVNKPSAASTAGYISPAATSGP